MRRRPFSSDDDPFRQIIHSSTAPRTAPLLFDSSFMYIYMPIRYIEGTFKKGKKNAGKRGASFFFSSALEVTIQHLRLVPIITCNKQLLGSRPVYSHGAVQGQTMEKPNRCSLTGRRFFSHSDVIPFFPSLLEIRIHFLFHLDVSSC